MLPRIDELDGPPTRGRYYLVPTVLYPWLRFDSSPWPVLLPLHDDVEFFGVDEQHYHIDLRFVKPSIYDQYADRMPIGLRMTPPGPPLPPVEWKRRKCYRSHWRYAYLRHPVIEQIGVAYFGAECPVLGGRTYCPHRGVDLTTIQPDEYGVVVCPGHGLRVRDGRCIGPLTRSLFSEA